jgi:hypothetical protein
MKVSTKELKFLKLLDSYIHCTRGGGDKDTYSILDEDDFPDFINEFRELYPCDGDYNEKFYR